MAKQTVQGMMLDEIRMLREQMTQIILAVESLKVKASIMGFIAGVVAAIISSVVSSFWHK